MHKFLLLRYSVINLSLNLYSWLSLNEIQLYWTNHTFQFLMCRLLLWQSVCLYSWKRIHNELWGLQICDNILNGHSSSPSWYEHGSEVVSSTCHSEESSKLNSHNFTLYIKYMPGRIIKAIDKELLGVLKHPRIL